MTARYIGRAHRCTECGHRDTLEGVVEHIERECPDGLARMPYYPDTHPAVRETTQATLPEFTGSEVRV